MTPIVRRVVVLGSAGLPWSWYVVRDVDPMLDWIAVLLPAVVAGAVGLAVALAAVLGQRSPFAIALVWSVFGAGAVVGPWSPAPTDPPTASLTVAAANIRGDNPTSTAVADDLLALDADVLVVSELSPLQADVAARLDERYTHSVRAAAQDGVGVWSDLPLADGRPALPTGAQGARGLRVVVDAPYGRFVVFGMHLFRPSRNAFETELTMPDHRALVETLVGKFDGERLPVVVAGDLNLTDRGASFRALSAGRVDALRSSWTGPTSLRARNRPLLLRIDHLLLPDDWCAGDGDRRRLTGSDHRAVLADVGPC